MTKEPLECAVCSILPPADEFRSPGYDGPLKPATPRPVVYGSTKPSRRCATHRRADVLARKAASHDASTANTYGVPRGWYAEQYERQGRKCAFPRCRATGKARRLAVDHDRAKAITASPEHPVAHDVARACRFCVRGLLCSPHNFDLLGRFAVDLQDGLDYLAAPPAQAWTWHPEAETG